MNRRKFLTRLVGAVVITPTAVQAVLSAERDPWSELWDTLHAIKRQRQNSGTGLDIDFLCDMQTAERLTKAITDYHMAQIGGWREP